MNLEITELSDLSTAGLEPYKTLRRPPDHIAQGIFVAEGEKVVRRLVSSNLKIVSMLMTYEWFDALSAEIREIPTDNDITRVYVAKKNMLEAIVGFNIHQGIMAVASVPPEPGADAIDRLLTKPHMLIAMDGLVNSENVGVIVRNCAAFGVKAVISGETSSSPYLRRAVRNSMGAVFSLPVIHSKMLSRTLLEFKEKHATKIIGADPNTNNSIYRYVFPGNICIVLGNEGSGVSDGILQICDERVAIPMMNATDSLNVASASAVFLSEAFKQRCGKK